MSSAIYQTHEDIKQLSKANIHKRTYIKKILSTIGQLIRIDNNEKYKDVIDIFTNIL